MSNEHSTILAKKLRATQKKLRGLEALEAEISKSGKPATIEQQKRLAAIPVYQKSIKDLVDIKTHFEANVLARSSDLEEFVRLLHASNLIHVAGHTAPKDSGAVSQVLQSAGKEARESDLDGLSHFVQAISGVIRNPGVPFQSRVNEASAQIRTYLAGADGNAAKGNFTQLRRALSAIYGSPLAAEPIPAPAPVPEPVPEAQPEPPAPTVAALPAVAAVPAAVAADAPAAAPAVVQMETPAVEESTAQGTEHAPSNPEESKQPEKRRRQRGRGGRGRQENGASGGEGAESGEGQVRQPRPPRAEGSDQRPPRAPRPEGEEGTEAGRPRRGRGGRGRGRGPRPQGEGAGAEASTPAERPAPTGDRPSAKGPGPRAGGRGPRPAGDSTRPPADRRPRNPNPRPGGSPVAAPAPAPTTQV